ncbi:SAM-dependent methyltransferase [Vibrio nereis]|uniref:Cyclopropane-fatty-acyl-phospholipid synthase n=1 Tax=Vibrio nereis TaxID=693 RepID=A0A0M0HU25_VIBNE|nr:cyclopropane-fatty-acyl-phospholipid synthase family protein [Vibrio nereis]KOO05392.1 cyclopropane-fatty-acyl-phospholipid synthase [Vibrio nereis]
MINSHAIPYPQQLSTGQKTARSLVFTLLGKLDSGSLTVVESFSANEPKQQTVFGHSQNSHIAAVIEVKNPAFYSRVLAGGSIAAAEAYMDGWWDSPDLTAVMELMAINSSTLDNLEGKSSIFTKLSHRIAHWLNRNTLENSAKNIEAHYDLSNELYATFLDEKMLYSSALYSDSKDTLEQAQENKMARLCEQLKLTEQDHVIEIGTGWGAMAIYMAERYGCQVTTTTISEEQYQFALKKIEEKGLTNRITLLKEDYRNLTGTYDKLVSIEMIEAVGKEYLNSYIQKCQSLLKPRGLMVIQAITIADQRYDYYSNNVDFIQKYIFPGGFLPSITALTQAATQNSDLVLRDLFDIGEDYAKTLNDWRVRFDLAEPMVRRLGFDTRFIRMWNYYFCYCEGGFKAKSISTVHMTFQRA